MWPRRSHPERCAAVGDALAQLHRAGATFDMQRRNSLSVEAWRPLLGASAPRADTVLPGLAKTLETELAHLEAHLPSDLHIGICHADLLQDNVFFRGDRLSGRHALYFAHTDILDKDRALCTNAWLF